MKTISEGPLKMAWNQLLQEIGKLRTKGEIVIISETPMDGFSHQLFVFKETQIMGAIPFDVAPPPIDDDEDEEEGEA